MKILKNSFINGAVYLALGSFFAKLLGAVYRVPLTNLIGGEGLGLYQMVFPVYCLLLDFSGAGFPNAISKLIAESNGDLGEIKGQKLLKDSIRLALILGVIGFILMLLFSKIIAKAQGDINASLGYVFLSPAVFFVSLLSCYRGYFQGKMNMKPTAISQIIEQGVKLVLGLVLAKIFMPNIPLAVGGATLAVTISEVVAFLYLFIRFKIKTKRKSNFQLSSVIIQEKFISNVKLLIKTALPITLISIAIPFSQVLDSFIVINFLNAYREDATSLFGLLTGSATTVINLPVSICYGIATSAIPWISKEIDNKIKDKYAEKARRLTMLISIPLSLLCLALAPIIVKVLFSSLGENERNITINLIRILSVNVVLLSFLQTQNAILTAKGKTYHALIGLLSGIGVKTILMCVLLPIRKVNIYGGAIAVFACYFTASLINFILEKYKGRGYEGKKSCNREFAN